MSKSSKVEIEVCLKVINGDIVLNGCKRFLEKSFNKRVYSNRRPFKIGKVLKKLERDRVIFKVGYGLYEFNPLAAHYAKKVLLNKKFLDQ